MYELAVVCAMTDARSPVQKQGELPDGWIAVESIKVGEGQNFPPLTQEDLHFANWDALAKWAASQGVKRHALGRRVA